MSMMSLACLEEAFREGGVLSRHLKGYVRRPQQLELARRVSGFLESGGILVAEAPTGVGKSLAYLIPCALYSEEAGNPVVISTNTKNLQDQLLRKDIPVVEAVCGRKIDVAVVKGRANYLCLERLDRLASQGELFAGESSAILEELRRWASKTRTGEISEFRSRLGSSSAIAMEELSASVQNCSFGECRRKKECFLNRLRERAQQADLVLVNHALLFSTRLSGSELLPEFSVLVADEGHHLDKALREALTVELEESILRSALADLAKALAHETSLLRRREEKDSASARRVTEQVRGAISEAELAVEEFFGGLGRLAFKAGERRVRYRSSEELGGLSGGDPERLLAAWDRCMSVASSLFSEYGTVLPHEGLLSAGAVSVETAQGELEEARAKLEHLLGAEDQGRVYWVGIDNRSRPRIGSCPIEVAGEARELLFERAEAVIVTSATLSTAEGFAHTLARLGLDSYGDERVETVSFSAPFDLESQLACFCLVSMPNPQEAGFPRAVASVLARLFVETGRKILALFTSYKMMHETREILSREGNWGEGAVLAQGYDGEKGAIAAAFSDGECRLLMGTSSFWEGMDFPGEQLELLVIVRLPFSVPSDPLVSASCERIAQRGGSAFREYFLPEAQLRFKQGLGRLIRRETDRGAVVVLDRRMVSSNYAASFRELLPVPIRLVEMEEELVGGIRGFFGEVLE